MITRIDKKESSSFKCIATSSRLQQKPPLCPSQSEPCQNEEKKGKANGRGTMSPSLWDVALMSTGLSWEAEGKDEEGNRMLGPGICPV